MLSFHRPWPIPWPIDALFQLTSTSQLTLTTQRFYIKAKNFWIYRYLFRNMVNCNCNLQIKSSFNSLKIRNIFDIIIVIIEVALISPLCYLFSCVNHSGLVTRSFHGEKGHVTTAMSVCVGRYERSRFPWLVLTYDLLDRRIDDVNVRLYSNRLHNTLKCGMKISLDTLFYEWAAVRMTRFCSYRILTTSVWTITERHGNMESIC